MTATPWDEYWRGADDPAQALAGGAPKEAFDAAWAALFDACELRSSTPITADLGCGAGVATKRARERFPTGRSLCIDGSPAAAGAAARLTKGAPITADLAHIPVADESVDLVLSQFGMEYGGRDALSEALRIVSSEGALLALCHYAGGAIEKECAANLELIDVVIETELLTKAREVFRISSTELTGHSPAGSFQRAYEQMRPVVLAVRDAVQAAPHGQARALLKRLFEDLGVMLNRRQAYALSDIEQWIDQNASALEMFRGRMSAMVAAALAESDIQYIYELARMRGLSAVAAPVVVRENEPPAAWRICVQTA